MDKLCNTSNSYGQSWYSVTFRSNFLTHEWMSLGIWTIYILFISSKKDTGILFVRIPLIASCASLFNLYRLEPIFLNRIRCKYRTAIHVEDSIEIKMPRSRELIASWILDLRLDSGFHISLEKSLTAVIIDACLMDGFYISAKKFHVPFDTDLSSGERYCIRNENILGGYSFFSVNKFSACAFPIHSLKRKIDKI